MQIYNIYSSVSIYRKYRNAALGSLTFGANLRLHSVRKLRKSDQGCPAEARRRPRSVQGGNPPRGSRKNRSLQKRAGAGKVRADGSEQNCTIRQCASAVTACTPSGSLPSRLQHFVSRLPSFSILPQCQRPRRRAARPICGVFCPLFLQISSLLVSAFRGKKSMPVKDPCLRREQLFKIVAIVA